MTYATRDGIPQQRSRPATFPAEGAQPYDSGYSGYQPYDSGYHAPETGPVNPAEQQQDRSSVEIRNLVVDRLRQMNARHAMHAFDRLRSDPLGPHGLAFLYRDVEVAGDPPRYAVRAATRLFPDGDDVAHLPRLLYEMTEIGREYLAEGGFDPLLCMTDRRDDMSSRAQYIGLGVSSLDTPSGTWQQLQTQATSALDLPGRSFALLVDGTRILLDRGDKYGGSGRIQSSHHLDTAPGLSFRTWFWLQEGDAATNEVWTWLQELHRTVLEGQRRNEQRAPRRRR